MSTAKLNDPALQAYYEALFEMYGSPGWRMLMEDIARMEAEHDRLDGLESGRALAFRQGQVDQMRWLKSHEQASEMSYNSLIAEQEGEAEVEASTGKAQVVA